MDKIRDTRYSFAKEFIEVKDFDLEEISKKVGMDKTDAENFFFSMAFQGVVSRVKDNERDIIVVNSFYSGEESNELEKFLFPEFEGKKTYSLLSVEEKEFLERKLRDVAYGCLDTNNFLPTIEDLNTLITADYLERAEAGIREYGFMNYLDINKYELQFLIKNSLYGMFNSEIDNPKKIEGIAASLGYLENEIPKKFLHYYLFLDMLIEKRKTTTEYTMRLDTDIMNKFSEKCGDKNPYLELEMIIEEYIIKGDEENE
jgi:hypothetical protein